MEKNIVFVNQHGSNKGDFAAFQTQIDLISNMFESKKIRLHVIYNVTTKGFDITDYKNIQINHLYDFTSTIREKLFYRLASVFPFFNTFNMGSGYIKKCKHVIDSADEIFLSNGGNNLGHYRDWRYMWRLRYSQYRKKQIKSFGNSISESGSKIFDYVKFRLIRSFEDYLCRDTISSNYLKSKKIKHTRTLDIVFAKTKNLFACNEVFNKIPNAVVFTPNELHSWHINFKGKDKTNIYVEVIDLLTERYQKNVILLPQLFSDNHINDYDYFLRLKKLSKKPDNVHVISDSSSVQEQLSYIRSSDYVIGGRYHSIVFALCQDVPVISISYESKMSGMMAFFNLSDYEMDVNDISIEKLEKIINLTKERNKFRVSHSAQNFVLEALK